MVEKETSAWVAEKRNSLAIDCRSCAGLCCVSLYCAKVDGFPENKAAGVPCKYLEKDFRCRIHDSLQDRGLKGCMAYDCFGAGQKTTQIFRSRGDWKENPVISAEMFRVFHRIFQLHQMKWFLLEALALADAEGSKEEIRSLIGENEEITGIVPEEIGAYDIEPYRRRVNPLLKDVIRKKGGGFIKGSDNRDFTMAILIGSDFSKQSLGESLFLGADLRDANLEGADLSKCYFLTQMQINSAKGDQYTKLPSGLSRPQKWVPQEKSR